MAKLRQQDLQQKGAPKSNRHIQVHRIICDSSGRAERWPMSLQVHFLLSFRSHGNQGTLLVIVKRQVTQICT